MTLRGWVSSIKTVSAGRELCGICGANGISRSWIPWCSTRGGPLLTPIWIGPNSPVASASCSTSPSDRRLGRGSRWHSFAPECWTPSHSLAFAPLPSKAAIDENDARDGGCMKALAIYTGLRLLLFAVVLVLLSLVGARGLLLALSVLISGIVSIVLLSPQRDALSSSLVSRWRSINDRIDARARAEDQPPRRTALVRTGSVRYDTALSARPAPSAAPYPSCSSPVPASAGTSLRPAWPLRTIPRGPTASGADRKASAAHAAVAAINTATAANATASNVANKMRVRRSPSTTRACASQRRRRWECHGGC